MNKKLFIVLIMGLFIIALNFSFAYEIDNSTDIDVAGQSSEILSISNESSLELNDLTKTHIDVASPTSFDVVGDSFKVKLCDDNNSSISNAKITFSLNGVNYTKNTDSNGIASFPLNIKDGTYTIMSKFAGNSKYQSSSKTTTVVMNNTRIVEKGLSNSQIQQIIDGAKDKNVILFKGSSYSNINLVINKRLTLITTSGTTLKSSSSSPVITVKGKYASYSIINGFNIQGNGNGVEVSDADYVRIINNDITSGGNGIVAAGTTYLNITKNNINKNSKSGIVIGNTVSTYIFNNNIKNNGANGIEIAKSDKVYIHGNTISNNGKNGISLQKTVNGINYGEGPKNVQINKNTISKNEMDGILVNYAGDNLNIKSNDIRANKANGISLAHVGSNTIQSNVVSENWENGIQFFDNYVKPSNQEISYNALYSNLHMDVEARDTYYQETGSRLELGDNWYSDFPGICPKIKSNNIKFTVTQIGSNQFQALFLDSKGNVAGLLPDRTLTYAAANGKKVSVTISGGAGVFTVDANDGDLIRAIVDHSQRDNSFNGDSKRIQPISGVTPSYEYPPIPYDEGGNGNGNGDGSGGNANRGNGNSNQGSSQNTGNSTHSQRTDPSSNANTQVNDVEQSFETQTTTSAEAASQNSAGDAGSSNSQSKSVVKQIVIDEDEFVKITGISFIILLIIFGIYLYYREDIRKMKSKL